MRLTHSLFHLVAIAIAAVIVSASPAFTTSLKAEDVVQKTFATPDDAIKALRSAVSTHDKTALNEIFGPDLKKLMTGDAVQDANNFQSFSNAISEKCDAEHESDDKVTLNIGADGWPFPIPLMKYDGQWFFDTEAGKDEIINRHIGRDELTAIGVCHSFVKAQNQYFTQDPEGTGTKQYAQKFKSTVGKKDGLYWKSSDATQASPLGELVSEARAEGYHHNANTGQQPYHGYYFKILTQQGHSALGGKKNYLADGKLTGGFALIAYPDRWDKSGIMTFIVNQDGQIYQRNLGKNTVKIASEMTEYNPTRKWTLVQDEGIAEK